MTANIVEAELSIGPSAISAYSRLNYTMWYALAEFIDNSTQSRENYDSIIDQVLQQEGRPLVVDITYNRMTRELRIRDNSIGMTQEDLIEALKVAHPTKDSKGRSKYGLGMKTAACWIGKRWQVITCELFSGEEWTATVDVPAIAAGNAKVPLTPKSVSRDAHYTEIAITDLYKNIQKRSEEVIKAYLGSMYRHDIKAEKLIITFNGDVVAAPDDYEWDTDPSGLPMRKDLPEVRIAGKRVKGWAGVLKRGGRRFGGFSIFKHGRQIQGFPSAWKPRSIYGGVDDEGANNLVTQRLTGVLELDDFEVSHTKDAIVYQGDEEDDLEKFLQEETKDYREYAAKRRGARGTPWSREKVKDLLESLKPEFQSDEMKDALAAAILPPLETIQRNNKQQLETLTPEDHVAQYDILPELRVVVSVQEKSEYEPYVTFVPGAQNEVLHVIINGLHPYYCDIESSDAMNECISQYIYDAIGEYRVTKLQGRVNPDTVRRLKDSLLRVKTFVVENANAAVLQKERDALSAGEPETKG
jgi:hypothetical protein